MMHQLRYGASSTLPLDVPAEALIADCTQVPGTPLSDVSAITDTALAGPVNFPPLRQAVVPGDQVVVAVDPDVPQAEHVVNGVVQALLKAGVEAGHITVLLSKRQARLSAWDGQFPAATMPIQIAVHDPNDRQQMAYLAASKDAAPIVLNRLLCDADLVLPINLLRPDSSLIYTGPHGGLCPTFADAATQQRFRTPNSMISHKQQHRRREEANEIAWLLGIQLTLEIIAGPGETLMHILAGLDEDASRQGQDLVKATWAYKVPSRAELVVATIEGEQDNRFWDNFGRALHTAQQLCAPDGTIILCTELVCKPGPALRRLAGFEEKDRLLQRLGNDRSEDAIPAWLLVEARDRSHVCLLSQLDEATVEALGIGYIDTPDRIHQLSRQEPSCILLGNAHRAVVTVES